ncbi:hypothetical protein Tsubulata_003486 [Turnera subulata]|uniref:CCHC-type domain-containing protein n=1 Tax=Turnera subulata TaxID=218843 RepID=A0A9Q0G9M5_9ROSI|nr:hypothetical protein Tsubulata_003486 [Turnera subulata]
MDHPVRSTQLVRSAPPIPSGPADELVPMIPGKSSQGKDQLENCNKKVKISVGECHIGIEGHSTMPDSVHSEVGECPPREETRRKSSYKEMLAGAQDTPMADLEQELEDYYADSGSDEEEDEDEECPVIRLSSDLKKRIRRPWLKTLFIKVLGRSVGYRFLHRSLLNQWKLKGQVTMADMGNDYYLLRFTNDEDYDRVLFDGPWMVLDHVVIVRRWEPHFDPDNAVIDKAVVWVQLPKLDLEYYHKEVLMLIGSRIGRVVKFDKATLETARCNYARICVEVDLTKPLKSKFKLRRRYWKVVYEGLQNICFHCGRVGHIRDRCPLTSLDSDVEVQGDEGLSNVEMQGALTRPEVLESFGPWMIAKRRRRRNTKPEIPNMQNPQGAGTLHSTPHHNIVQSTEQRATNRLAAGNSSRFNVLAEVNDEDESNVVTAPMEAAVSLPAIRLASAPSHVQLQVKAVKGPEVAKGKAKQVHEEEGRAKVKAQVVGASSTPKASTLAQQMDNFPVSCPQRVVPHVPTSEVSQLVPLPSKPSSFPNRVGVPLQPAPLGNTVILGDPGPSSDPPDPDEETTEGQAVISAVLNTPMGRGPDNRGSDHIADIVPAV